MTTEEKAKAYDEAIERAKVWRNKSGMPDDKQGIIDSIFPNLAESEDKRVKNMLKCAVAQTPWSMSDKKICCVWIEKQCEKKSANVSDEWIEDYWQHKKALHPDSYDVGYEIQFNHQGFVDFCKAYCQEPIEWSEEDNKNFNRISAVLNEAHQVREWWTEERLITTSEADELIAWLKKVHAKKD